MNPKLISIIIFFSLAWGMLVHKVEKSKVFIEFIKLS